MSDRSASGLSQPPYTKLAGALQSLLLSAPVWFIEGGAAGHGPLCGGGGCFCLWKRGRKRRLVSSFGVRRSLARVRSVSEKSPVAPAPTGTPAAPDCASEDASWSGTLSCLHSLGCLPKMLHCCSATTEGWDFQKRWLCFEKQEPLQMSAAQDVAVSASCLLATVRAAVAEAPQPVSGYKGRDPRLVLLDLADELSRSSWRETCLICQTSSNS